MQKCDKDVSVMGAAPTQSLLLINCLERFERQSQGITSRRELVELFCTQVIPLLAENELLDDLRKAWISQRDQLKRKVQDTEARALEEIYETFVEVKTTIGDPANEKMTLKLALIERLISGEEKCGTERHYIASSTMN
jgi:hypothetical protein